MVYKLRQRGHPFTSPQYNAVIHTKSFVVRVHSIVSFSDLLLCCDFISFHFISLASVIHYWFHCAFVVYNKAYLLTYLLTSSKQVSYRQTNCWNGHTRSSEMMPFDRLHTTSPALPLTITGIGSGGYVGGLTPQLFMWGIFICISSPMSDITVEHRTALLGVQ